MDNCLVLYLAPLIPIRASEVVINKYTSGNPSPTGEIIMPMREHYAMTPEQPNAVTPQGPNALALEYQLIYGSAHGNLDVSDLVNNPSANGKCRIDGPSLTEHTLNLTRR